MGIIAKKISAIFAFINAVIAKEKISINGALTAIRIIIWYAFWILVTSVVSLVTRLEVENLSMFEKEKVCTRSYMSFLKFFAKPADAIAAYFPDKAPQLRDSRESTTSNIPIVIICRTLFAAIPLSIILAISVGIKTSMITSSVTNNGDNKEDFLYSRIDFANRFIIFVIIPFLYCKIKPAIMNTSFIISPVKNHCQSFFYFINILFTFSAFFYEIHN